MGNLQPVLTDITKTLGTINDITSGISTLANLDNRSERKALRAEQEFAMQNLQAQQGLSEKQAREQAEQDRRRIALDAEEEEKRRRNALRRSIAKQNAGRGASGISSSGSNEAILLGLYNDADDDRSYSQALDDLRYNTINSDLYRMNERNVLERTQLAEQQRLQRASRG
jgi:hypothetical protein